MSSVVEQSNLTLQELKEKFAEHLCTPEEVRHPEGVGTGLEALDRFLFWHGIPKGALTLFNGSLGTGATSLWLEAAQRTVNQGKWVVWINRDVPLSPLPLKQKGMNLGHFVSIELPTAELGAEPNGSLNTNKPNGSDETQSKAHEKAAQEKIFWLLQELMSSSLFELVGCDLGEQQLKDHQLRKLQAQARDSNVALVFFSQAKDRAGSAGSKSKTRKLRGATASIFSLIISFQKKRILIERALHRPTPHSLPRSVSYARFVLNSSLATGDLAHKSTPDNGDTHPLLETPRASLTGAQSS
jgi:RecA/RadA recombinase